MERHTHKKKKRKERCSLRFFSVCLPCVLFFRFSQSNKLYLSTARKNQMLNCKKKKKAKKKRREKKQSSVESLKKCVSLLFFFLYYNQRSSSVSLPLFEFSCCKCLGYDCVFVSFLFSLAM